METIRLEMPASERASLEGITRDNGLTEVLRQLRAYAERHCARNGIGEVYWSSARQALTQAVITMENASTRLTAARFQGPLTQAPEG
jgi:hypothetical protein